MSGESAESSESSEKLWYVLKVQTNRERTIRDALLKKIKLEGLEECFGEIMIPSEKVVDTRSGKAKEQDRKLFPGYIMINMALNDETWYLVRDTGGVGDFAGAAGKPMAMEQFEVDRMLGKAEEDADSAPKVKIEFSGTFNLKIRKLVSPLGNLTRKSNNVFAAPNQRRRPRQHIIQTGDTKATKRITS